MSKRQFFCMVLMGPISWSAQVMMIVYLWIPVHNTFRSILIGVLVLFAYLCFEVVIDKWPKTSDLIGKKIYAVLKDELPLVKQRLQENSSRGFAGMVILGEIMFTLFLGLLLLLDTKRLLEMIGFIS